MLLAQTIHSSVSLASHEKCFQSRQDCLAAGLQASTAPRSARIQLPKQANARIVCNATDTADKPTPEDLTDKEKEHWQDGVQELISLGMDDVLAEKSLKRGFGWSSQAYWWKDKVNDVPKPGEIKEKLEYLRGLGLDNDQLHQVVKQFPETVGLDLEKRMKPNVELMGKQFFIKGKMLPKTLARKPQALGLWGGDSPENLLGLYHTWGED